VDNPDQVKLRTRRNGTEKDRKRQQEQSAQAKEDVHSYSRKMQRGHKLRLWWRGRKKQTICLETALLIVTLARPESCNTDKVNDYLAVLNTSNGPPASSSQVQSEFGQPDNG
jgi:hypothetical protein